MDDRFADAFKVARQAAGLSQSDVAERMQRYGYEMSQPVIGKIERGERKVTIGEGEALSWVVGYSTRTLLEGPTVVRLERGVEFVRLKAREVGDAVERFQTAQQALATMLDRESDADHPSTRFTRHEAAALLELTPAEILASYEKDVRAKMQSLRFRNELDGPAEEEPDQEDWLPKDSYLGRYLESRGDSVDSMFDAAGFREAYEYMQVPRSEVADGSAADAAE